MDEAGASALREWTETERDRTMALALGKSTEAVDGRREALLPTLREHCVEIRFRGLTEEERDALVSAHTVPETDAAELAKDPKATRIDRVPFLADALAAAVLDEDNLAADEWEKELRSERWTAGDVAALFQRVVATTGEQPALSIPFG